MCSQQVGPVHNLPRQPGQVVSLCLTACLPWIRASGCLSVFMRAASTWWSTARPSKVNLPQAINFRALCGAKLVTLRSKFRPIETRELHCVVTSGGPIPLFRTANLYMHSIVLGGVELCLLHFGRECDQFSCKSGCASAADILMAGLY